MTLIQIKLIEGLYTTQQKRELVERLTDVMADIGGESIRRTTWCVVEEIASGDWGLGGHTLTTDDIRALARS